MSAVLQFVLQERHCLHVTFLLAAAEVLDPVAEGWRHSGGNLQLLDCCLYLMKMRECDICVSHLQTYIIG